MPDSGRHLVEASLATLVRAGCHPALVVVKRFGPADPGPLSFPLAGWTVAVDLPAGTPRLDPTLEQLDDEVADAGGRIYLAKDARLHRRQVERMYPGVEAGARRGPSSTRTGSSARTSAGAWGWSDAGRHGTAAARPGARRTSEIGLATVRAVALAPGAEVVLAGRDGRRSRPRPARCPATW